MKKRVTLAYTMDFLIEMADHLKGLSNACDDQQVRNVLESYSRQIIMMEHEYAMEKSRLGDDQ